MYCADNAHRNVKLLLHRGANNDQATAVRMSKKTKKLAVERRDGNFLDRVQVPPIVTTPQCDGHADAFDIQIIDRRV